MSLQQRPGSFSKGGISILPLLFSHFLFFFAMLGSVPVINGAVFTASASLLSGGSNLTTWVRKNDALPFRSIASLTPTLACGRLSTASGSRTP